MGLTSHFNLRYAAGCWCPVGWSHYDRPPCDVGGSAVQSLLFCLPPLTMNGTALPGGCGTDTSVRYGVMLSLWSSLRSGERWFMSQLSDSLARRCFCEKYQTFVHIVLSRSNSGGRVYLLKCPLSYSEQASATTWYCVLDNAWRDYLRFHCRPTTPLDLIVRP